MKIVLFCLIFCAGIALASITLNKLIGNIPKRIERKTQSKNKDAKNQEANKLIVKNASLIACGGDNCVKITEFEIDQENNNFGCNDDRVRLLIKMQNGSEAYAYYENYQFLLYTEQKQTAFCPLIKR